MRAALPTLILAFASCSGDLGTSPTQMGLVQARQRWARFGAASYQITVGHDCFCLPDATRPAIVTVRNGQVESRRYEDTGADVPAQFASAYPTVEGLFDLIAAAIARHAETVDARYDASRGFPVTILVDGSARMADDETFYATRDFIVR